MELTPFDIFNVILQLIFSVISIIVGLILISKYPKSKNKTFIYVGIVWIGISLPWFGSVINALIFLLAGATLDPRLRLFIIVGLLPITVFIWFIAFTDLAYKDKQKIILIIIALFGTIFEIVFFYFLFTDLSKIAELHSPIHVEYTLFTQIYLFVVLVISLVTGIIFGLRTMQSEEPEYKLRGKLLIIAFISFVAASISDSIYTPDYLILLITRIVLISSAIEFYCAFALPKWMKKLCLKTK